MWMFTKAWPQQRRIWIIKWIGWPVLTVSQPLSPATPIIDQLGSQTKWPQWCTHLCILFPLPLHFLINSSQTLINFKISINNKLQFDKYLLKLSVSPSQHQNHASSYMATASPIFNSRAAIARATVFLTWKWNQIPSSLLPKMLLVHSECCMLSLVCNPNLVWACAELYNTYWPKSPLGHNTEKPIPL